MQRSHIERDYCVIVSKIRNCEMTDSFVPPQQDISDLRNPIHICLAGRGDTLSPARVLKILATDGTSV